MIFYIGYEDGVLYVETDMYHDIKKIAVEATNNTAVSKDFYPIEVLVKLTEPQTYITEDRDTQILDAWQVKLKAEQTEPSDKLTARCLNCKDAKACKKNHWEGCKYETYTEQTEPQIDCAWK